jgi:hypothetical protein
MTWENATPPTPPTSLTIKGGSLSWEGSVNQSGAPFILYNVYCSHQYPVDINDARNLIATRLTNTQLHFSKNIEDKYFAITAMDRYGNESAPLQSYQPTPTYSPKAELLTCNGYQVELPEKGSVLDADMIVIETMQGKPVAVLPYRGKTANVADIKEGFYVMKSLNKKGRTHRLGFFMIKRHE